jgi:hypothetical protein
MIPISNREQIRVLEYGHAPHKRKHGPHGYSRYTSYKAWLRDEFDFRCVYCLFRETWSPQGQAAFCVDHVLPKRQFPDQINRYDNLVYVCARCNALKEDVDLGLDPCQIPLGEHVYVTTQGLVEALTSQGAYLVDILRLNHPQLIEFRRQITLLFELLEQKRRLSQEHVTHSFFGLPSDLPNLAQLAPPSGNTRPHGVAHSYYAQDQRGERFDMFY